MAVPFIILPALLSSAANDIATPFAGCMFRLAIAVGLCRVGLPTRHPWSEQVWAGPTPILISAEPDQRCHAFGAELNYDLMPAMGLARVETAASLVISAIRQKRK